MDFIIILYFITLLIFLSVSFEKLKKEINNIIFAIKFNSIPINKNQIINKREITRKNTKKITKKKGKRNNNNKNNSKKNHINNNNINIRIKL